MKFITIAALLGAISAIELERHHHHHKHNTDKFADGMAWGDKLGETIRVKDVEGGSGRLLPVHLHQKQFAEGMNDDEEVGDSVKMTEPAVRDSKKWRRTYKFAKKPVAEDSLVQLDMPKLLNPNAPPAGPTFAVYGVGPRLNRGPGVPALIGEVQGEKQW